MVLQNHHDWLTSAATTLILSTDILWQAMCAEWVISCLTSDEAKKVIQPIEDALIGVTLNAPPTRVRIPMPQMDANGNQLLFGR
jgi:hypothetical protein